MNKIRKVYHFKSTLARFLFDEVEMKQAMCH